MVELAAVVYFFPEIFILKKGQKCKVICYRTRLTGGDRGSDIVIQFQLGLRLTLPLMCNVGKAGSDESFSVKGNGNEKQQRGGKCYTSPAVRRQQSLI